MDWFSPLKKQRNGSEFSDGETDPSERVSQMCCFYPLRNNKYHLLLSLIAPYCRSSRGFQLDSSRMARIEVACDATFALLSSASLWRLSLMLQEFNSSAIPAQGTRGGRGKTASQKDACWKPAAEPTSTVVTRLSYSRSCWEEFVLEAVFCKWLYLTVPGCRWGLAHWTWLPLLPLDPPASSATWAAALLLWKEPSWTLSGHIQTINTWKKRRHVCVLPTVVPCRLEWLSFVL